MAVRLYCCTDVGPRCPLPSCGAANLWKFGCPGVHVVAGRTPHPSERPHTCTHANMCATTYAHTRTLAHLHACTQLHTCDYACLHVCALTPACPTPACSHILTLEHLRSRMPENLHTHPHAHPHTMSPTRMQALTGFEWILMCVSGYVTPSHCACVRVSACACLRGLREHGDHGCMQGLRFGNGVWPLHPRGASAPR